MKKMANIVINDKLIQFVEYFDKNDYTLLSTHNKDFNFKLLPNARDEIAYLLIKNNTLVDKNNKVVYSFQLPSVLNSMKNHFSLTAGLALISIFIPFFWIFTFLSSILFYKTYKKRRNEFFLKYLNNTNDIKINQFFLQFENGETNVTLSNSFSPLNLLKLKFKNHYDNKNQYSVDMIMIIEDTQLLFNNIEDSFNKLCKIMSEEEAYISIKDNYDELVSKVNYIDENAKIEFIINTKKEFDYIKNKSKL